MAMHYLRQVLFLPIVVSLHCIGKRICAADRKTHTTLAYCLGASTLDSQVFTHGRSSPPFSFPATGCMQRRARTVRIVLGLSNESSIEHFLHHFCLPEQVAIVVRARKVHGLVALQECN